MRIVIIVLLISFTACRSLPKQKLFQFEIDSNVYVANDSLYLEISNPVHSPLTMNMVTSKRAFNDSLSKLFPIVLPAFSDTCVKIYSQYGKEELDPQINIQFGSNNDSVNIQDFSLPFPPNKSYKIVQGYNGSFSHNKPLSQHAIDFKLIENDTVSAVADGYVVGVIKDYEYGGGNERWRDYANFITLYHPKYNVISQYVHLVKNGSFVAVGDTVKVGQPIGLSGNTGFTQGDHLHFNVYAIINEEMKSIPVSFIEGYRGQDLKKGDWVKK